MKRRGTRPTSSTRSARAASRRGDGAGLTGNLSADALFVGGRVYTVDAARPWAEAVAVRDGRISAVGSDRDLRDQVSQRTEVIPLEGKMLLPAFQDAHVHAVGGGFVRLHCDLSGGRRAEDYLRIIREYAASHPGPDWIVGGGWSMDAFPGGIPSHEPLDAVVPDRPVFLPNRDGHGAWVNTVALRRAGIDAATPDPPGGRIERDTAGAPIGMLQEGAMDLVLRVVPRPKDAEIERALLVAQEHLLSLGIAAWQEAIVGEYAGEPDSFDAYVRLTERGQLTARVVGALWWGRDEGLAQVDRLLARRARSLEAFQATTVKIMLDGVCENFTASMLEPYLGPDGQPSATSGTGFFDPGALQEYVVRLDAAGFQVHFHAIGDRAVREALDAVEAAARANGDGDRRHHIAHIQVVDPADIPRFHRLRVTANAQPLWACLEPQMTELTIPFLGPRRARNQYPFARLLEQGARLAFGSDWPVSSPNPIEGIHVAVNRVSPSAPGAGPAQPAFLPEERIGLDAAIAAYTLGSAYVNHRDHDSGSIEIGKRADLVVLNQDLFALRADEIAQARAVLTMVDGKIAWSADRG